MRKSSEEHTQTGTKHQSMTQDSSNIIYSPKKQRPIEYVYSFYCKQTYVQGKHATFDRQQHEINTMSLQKFLYFCRDFGLTDRLTNMETFKKISQNSKDLDLKHFELVIDKLAQKVGVSYDQYVHDLGLHSIKECKKRMRLVRKPFNIKENHERVNQSEIKYQFRLFNPEVRDQEQIRQIMEQRRYEKEYMRSVEREKKDLAKLQYKLKFESGAKLTEVYPEKRHLIERLQQKQIKPHISYTRNSHTYNNNNERLSKDSNSYKDGQITWEGLNHISKDEEMLRQLIVESDDEYLDEYSITKPSNIQYKQKPQESYGRIDQYQLKKRSLSEYQNVQLQEIVSHVMGPYIVNTKRNHNNNNNMKISTMKRAKEVENMQNKKQLQLLEQILYMQHTKETRIIK